MQTYRAHCNDTHIQNARCSTGQDRELTLFYREWDSILDLLLPSLANTENWYLIPHTT